eukprot:Pgem_evm1s12192
MLIEVKTSLGKYSQNGLIYGSIFQTVSATKPERHQEFCSLETINIEYPRIIKYTATGGT